MNLSGSKNHLSGYFICHFEPGLRSHASRTACTRRALPGLPGSNWLQQLRLIESSDINDINPQ